MMTGSIAFVSFIQNTIMVTNPTNTHIHTQTFDQTRKKTTNDNGKLDQENKNNKQTNGEKTRSDPEKETRNKNIMPELVYRISYTRFQVKPEEMENGAELQTGQENRIIPNETDEYSDGTEI